MPSQQTPFIHANATSEVTRPDPAKLEVDKISKNPYRQALATSAPGLSRSVSQETQSSNPSRSKYVRTVFHDLPTAHSSIMSGTARGRQRGLSNSLSEANEEDSIPLQEFEPSKRNNNTPPFSPFELPLPPPPAATIHHRINKHSSESDCCLVIEEDDFASSKPTKPNLDKGKQKKISLKGSSVYHYTFGAAPSSSLPPNSVTNKPSLDDDNRPRNHNHTSYSAAIPFPDFGSTPVPQKTNPQIPRQSFKTTRALSNTASSLPEGSTVGNIYKHYVRSEIFDDTNLDDGHSEYDLADGYLPVQGLGNRAASNDLSSDSPSNDQLEQSALGLRTQRRAGRTQAHGRPPSSRLPSIPNASSRLLPSSSQDIGPSTSYGDTQNLLELTESCPQPTLNRSNGRSDVLPNQDLSDHSLQDTHLPSTNNPFRGDNGPHIYISRPNNENYGYDDYRSYVNNHNQDRQPLEREVSQALRRASNFSAYTDGSIATSVVENYGHFQSEVSSSDRFGMIRRHMASGSQSEPEVDEETQVVAGQAQAFYDREAISATWIANNQRNMIRVPIQHNRNLTNSPVLSPRDGINSNNGDSRDEMEIGDDANDWETVGESGNGTEYKGSIPAMLGEEMAHRTGSSIADTSDEGTTTIPEISDYGSTERITQHPGNIQYSGDYRQRDLKKSKIPIFLPVYGEHKVNGYLADSNRLRAPPNPFNYTPKPLERKHTNPFNSPPPEITTKPSACRPYSSQPQRAPNYNHCPSPASIKTNSSSDERGITERRIGSIHRNRSGAVENFSRPFNWMDNFGDPGPAINSNRATGDYLKPIPQVAELDDRPSSWQHIMAFARGDTVDGYNADGSRTVDSPLGRGFIRQHSFSGHPLAEANNDGFVEQKTYGGKQGPAYTKERSTLVKGPPGAFYQDLSRPNPDRSQSSNEKPRRFGHSYRQPSVNEYPTNALRTLSLVASDQNRPSTPSNSMDEITDIGPDPSLLSRPNDFVYRSPLAPPKRKTWQELYTQKQMSEFQETAKVNGIFQSRESRTVELNVGLLGSRDPEERASSRHLGEVPRLWGGQQRQRVGTRFYQSPTRIRTDQPAKKKRISIIVLCLCNLFFPLLIPFANGNLDWVMLWWTTGEYYSFGRPQKRTAIFCFVGWCIVVFMGLLGFLIWWFAIR